MQLVSTADLSWEGIAALSVDCIHIPHPMLSSNYVDLFRYSTSLDFFGIYFLQSRFFSKLLFTCNEVTFLLQISTFYTSLLCSQTCRY